MNNTPLITSWMQTQPRQPSWTLPGPAWGRAPLPSELEILAGGFDPISLKQMESVALLNRIDVKFILSTGQLLSVLAELQTDYSMLSIHGRRLNHYRTLYFDTPDFDLYRAHVNGRAERYKVRSREYTDSGLSYLEVKHKTSKDRTIKDRLSTDHPVVQMTPQASDWLRGVAPFDGQALEPRLWNTFTRLTLVSKRYCERLTLDVDLTFYMEDKVIPLDGVAIAEMKIDAGHRTTPFLAQMNARRIRPRGFSKYCIGVSLLYDQVKKNAMKPRLLWLDKLTRGAYTNDYVH